MAAPTIDYEKLAQDAMRSVVRTVMQRVQKSGLPGDHHFYVSFKTGASGVMLSKRLREKYPEEMTIVLQHRFSNLLVQDDRFEVTLSFDSIPERLAIPFAAIKVFFDPSVPYGIQFEAQQGEGGEPMLGRPTLVESGSNERTRADSDSEAMPERRPSAPKPVKAIPSSVPSSSAGLREAPKRDGAKLSEDGKPKPADRKPQIVTRNGEETEPATPAPAKVVELDAFRKK